MKDNLVEFAEWWKSVYKEKLAAVYIDKRFTNDKRYEMNKKIKLLAKQAKIDYDLRPEIARAPVWIGTDEELEKFAELIVRECGAVALNIGCGDIEDELLKHFGVE